MELRDENRIIVKNGLALMANTRNMGLKALMQATGTDPSHIKPYTVGFVLEFLPQCHRKARYGTQCAGTVSDVKYSPCGGAGRRSESHE